MPGWHTLSWLGGNMGLLPLGHKEIDGLLVHPGKAYINSQMTNHLITG